MFEITVILYVLGVVFGTFGVLGVSFGLVMLFVKDFGADLSKRFFVKCFTISGVCIFISLIIFSLPIVYGALFLN